MSATLPPAELAEIRQRLEHAASFDDEPKCACVQTDVDFFNNFGCSLCNSNSTWNIDRRKAERQIELHAAHNLSALLGHIAEQDREIADLRAAVEAAPCTRHCMGEFLPNGKHADWCWKSRIGGGK